MTVRRFLATFLLIATVLGVVASLRIVTADTPGAAPIGYIEVAPDSGPTVVTVAARKRAGGPLVCVGGPGQAIGVKVCVPSTYRRIPVTRVYEDGSAIYVAKSSGRVYVWDAEDQRFRPAQGR